MFKRFITAVLKALGILKSVPGEPPTVELPEPGHTHPGPEAARQIRLGIIVGHEAKAGGAACAVPVGGCSNEYQLNSVIANEIKEYSNRVNGIDVQIIKRDGIGIAGAYKKAYDLNCDCVIELHFNAFNKKAVGTLTYTSPSAEDVEYSHYIQKAMVGVFGTNGRPDRGVVALARGDRGSRNVFSFNGMPNCLVEPVFGDVKSEINMLWDKRKEYAAALVNATLLWAKKKDLV